MALLSAQRNAEAESRGPVQCLCGRFARWLSDRSYYDGNYDCYSYDVDCGRCGVVTVECV